jgi:uncharacterized protein (TIGR03083 family)
VNDLMNLEQRLGQIQADSGRLAELAEHEDLTASVTTCPGWDLRQLLAHVGYIHRWATHAVQHAAAPEQGTIVESDPAASGDELATWLRAGSGALLEVLAVTPADAATWHPFPVERKAWVWSRRQMMETAVHRWDAEVATSGTSVLSPEVATIGIHEYLELGIPRVLKREKIEFPSASLHVHCTDDEVAPGSGEWIVWADDGEYRMETEHRKGDAALRGTAADLLLVLMGRLDRASIETVGDPEAAAAWLDLPGW